MEWNLRAKQQKGICAMKSFLKTALVLAGMIAWGAGRPGAQINPSHLFALPAID